MKLSWFNTSMGTQTKPSMYKMSTIYSNARYKRDSVRDSGSNANTKICFEVRATALRSRLHTERFSLVHTRPPIEGTSTEEFAITKLKYTTPLSNTTTSTQEARH